MKNLAALSAQQPSLGPTKIKALEALAEDARRDALRKLGSTQLTQARDDWRRIGRNALERKADLQEGRDYFYAVTESHDERRAYDNKIQDAAGDVQQADIIVEILDRYISLCERAGVETVLLARATELRVEKPRGALLKELNAALVNTANVLSKILQHNAEAGEINRALTDGTEQIPLLNVMNTSRPGRHSLIDWLTRDVFPIRELPEPAVLQWPGPAGYPQAVQDVLRKLDEEKRAAFAAARARPDNGPSRLSVGYSRPRSASEDSNS